MHREHRVEAGRLERGYWTEFRAHFDLLRFLSWQNVHLRYRQTWAGVAWTVMRPILLTIALTGVFGVLARLPAGSNSYVILSLSGVAPWIFVSSIITACCFSVNNYAYLISKVYFPRLILPTSTVLLNLFDFLVVFAMLLGLMAWNGILPSHRIFLFPAFLVLALVAALAIGIWVAALNVRYRDVGIAIPLLTQCWIFISPVGFSSDIVPSQWRLIYSINPLVGIIDLFRHLIFRETSPIYFPSVAISAIVSLLLLLTGARYFRLKESTFADIA